MFRFCKIQWTTFKFAENIWTKSSEPWTLSIEQWTELIVIFQNTSNACEYIQFNSINWWKRCISILLLLLSLLLLFRQFIKWCANVELQIANGWYKENSQIYPKIEWSSCSANQIKFNEFQIFSANNLKMFLCFLNCCLKLLLLFELN